MHQSCHAIMTVCVCSCRRQKLPVSAMMMVPAPSTAMPAAQRLFKREARKSGDLDMLCVAKLRQKHRLVFRLVLV